MMNFFCNQKFKGVLAPIINGKPVSNVRMPMKKFYVTGRSCLICEDNDKGGDKRTKTSTPMVI